MAAQEKLFFGIAYICKPGWPDTMFTMWAYSSTRAGARAGMLHICARRNAMDVPDEFMRMHAVYEIDGIGTDGMSGSQAARIEAENKIAKEYAGLPAPEDVSETHGNLVFHRPVFA